MEAEDWKPQNRYSPFDGPAESLLVTDEMNNNEAVNGVTLRRATDREMSLYQANMPNNLCMNDHFHVFHNRSPYESDHCAATRSKRGTRSSQNKSTIRYDI